MDITGPPTTVDEVIPPADPVRVYRIGLIGAAGCAVAALLGLAALAVTDEIPAVSTVRLILVAVGLLTAGGAISLRPGLWMAWAIGGLAAGLAIGGLPGHWDSARLLVSVMTVLAFVGAGLTAAPPALRATLVSCVMVFHFGGILTATTWPDPAPWLTNQAAYRVYMPYLTFMYLRNAYHFYSPEPGPSSHLFVLLTYELDEIDPATKKKKIVHEWVTLPRRDEHMKDPLGLSYYRRLSITEMVSPAIPGLVSADNFENLDARLRRVQASQGTIPLPNPDPSGGTRTVPIPVLEGVEAATLQYRIPQPHISRYLLPSYARHLAAKYSAPGRTVTNVRIYRVEHRITPTYDFRMGMSPYHPSSYRPYFCGDYDAEGKLRFPQDPMLYWLVPIPPARDPSKPGGDDYTDFLTEHAGYQFDWGRIRP